jgi:hypothetical protein
MRTKHAMRAALILGACLAAASPVRAEQDEGWFWGRGMMGRWFQGGMMDQGMMDGWGHGMMMGHRLNEERLKALKSELAISDAQAKAWDDYAAAITAAARTMREAHMQMMSAQLPATLPERLVLHDNMMSSRHETMKKISEATLALYNTLDANQKKKADEVIMGIGMM